MTYKNPAALFDTTFLYTGWILVKWLLGDALSLYKNYLTRILILMVQSSCRECGGLTTTEVILCKDCYEKKVASFSCYLCDYVSNIQISKRDGNIGEYSKRIYQLALEYRVMRKFSHWFYFRHHYAFEDVR